MLVITHRVHDYNARLAGAPAAPSSLPKFITWPDCLPAVRTAVMPHGLSGCPALLPASRDPGAPVKQQGALARPCPSSRQLYGMLFCPA